MDIDSHNIAIKNDHFGVTGLGVRTICSTSIYYSPQADWQIIQRAYPGSAITSADNVDCWLLAAVDLPGLELEAVAAGVLPLVIVADAPIPADWLDLADGVILPEDDATTIGAVLSRATLPRRGQPLPSFPTAQRVRSTRYRWKQVASPSSWPASSKSRGRHRSPEGSMPHSSVD